MSAKMVLVIEDEDDVAELLRYNLEQEGYKTEVTASGEQGLDMARKLLPDLVLLDIMLPGLDGMEVCRRLKQSPDTTSIPVVMLTAKSEESDMVAGLELGADDYVTKPFSPKVLLARIKAVLRRRHNRPEPDDGSVLRVHDLVVDRRRHLVRLADQTVELTHTEFAILYFLASHPGWAYTRTQIVDGVHGSEYPVTERSVDVHVMSLRRKLGHASRYIQTVRGVGYRFAEKV